MAANNETGVVSDLAAIEALLAQCAPAALWMVDSVQALGKLRLDLAATRIDYAPFSGHKLYAPKGIGMLYVREGAPYTPLMVGGGQEGGQRSGTENMAGIAALGAVLEALEDGAAFRTHGELAAFRERLAGALRAAFPGIVFNMPFAHSLPTTLNFSVQGLGGKQLLDVFDAAGVRVSSGSACSAAKAAPSYVLEAMGLPAWRSGAAVRMSLGPMVDEAFIDAACVRIARCGAALRDAGLLCAGTVASAAPSVEEPHAVPAADVATAEERMALALDPAGLEAFLSANPGARLVDVREAWEHAAGAAGWQGRGAENVPLSGLPLRVDEWLLGDQPALVFFCRSGNRSERAALSLRRRGYRNAWHLAGGIALAA
jgi:rhodanese-related sulfurtransferase